MSHSSSSSSSSGDSQHNLDPTSHGVGSSQTPSSSPQLPQPSIPSSPNPLHPVPYPPYTGHNPPYPPAAYPYPPAAYPYPPPNAAMPPYRPLPVYSPPRRGSLKPLWITLGVALSLVVVFCTGCSLLLSLSLAQLSSPTTAAPPASSALDPVIGAQVFCAYEIDQDYSNAYQQLSANLQSQLSEQHFESDNQARDASSGPVIGCSAAPKSSNPEDEGPAASPTTLSLYVWLGAAATSHAPPLGLSGNITMVQEGSSWKVDALDRAVRLT
ncbi:MAG: hypothetical protein ACLQUY_12935 [Ktedonobacterales bacterium]